MKEAISFYPNADYFPDDLAILRKAIELTPMESEPFVLQTLFLEQLLTNRRIEQLGNPGLDAQKIPDIDNVFNLLPINRQIGCITIIEVGGMIGAGKDTSIFSIPENDWLVYWAEEPARYVKRWRQNVKGPKIATASSIRPYLEAGIYFESKFEKGGSIIRNRGEIDDVSFLRSLFASRNIFPDLFEGNCLNNDGGGQNHYAALMKIFELIDADFPNVERKLPEAMFVFLVNPFEGLRRKLAQLGRKPDEFSTLLNPNFMLTLYQQYLRLISELRDNNQPNLVVIDANKPKDVVVNNFQNLLAAILGK